jgi:hypothetical protein
MRVPERVNVSAQIDSGSPYTTFAPFVFQRLEIQPIDKVLLRMPSSGTEACEFNQYVVSLSLSGDGLELHLGTLEVIEAIFATEEGIQAMLGRDLLEHCLFIYDGQHKTFSLAF